MNNEYGEGTGKSSNRTLVVLVALVVASLLCFGCSNADDASQGSSSYVPQVSSSDLQLPSGAVSWQEASRHIGETVEVYGPVAAIEYDGASKERATYIDLGVSYPDSSRVTMIVNSADKEAFPESLEVMYAGKTLCVSGKIFQHDGVCYIDVTSPSQVQVLE